LKGPQAQLTQHKELLALELEKVHTTEPLTPLSIDALFDMTIVEGGEDWAKDLEPERGSPQWLDEFLQATRLDPLPTWAIDELRMLAFALEIRIIVERGDGDKPKYTLEAINMTQSAFLDTDARASHSDSRHRSTMNAVPGPRNRRQPGWQPRSWPSAG
ncbi:MAG: hypothetical protein V3V82_03735, partial [Acidimicrobiia bacterium]